jgi:chemosensory pili system protein ChpA (sensor histidine kinase/response regulator)
LRQWVAEPTNGAARIEVLRTLHTVKGSARLAGALRLGDMAHHMETQAERLGSDVQDSAQVEPLLASCDGLVARFDELCLPLSVAVPNRITTAAEVVVPVEDYHTQPLAVAEALPTDMPLTEVDAVQTAVQSVQADGLVPMNKAMAATRLHMPIVKSATAVAVRVRPELLDRLVNQTGEVMITRSRMEAELGQLRGSLTDLTGNLDRLRHQLRDIELQAESQMQTRLAQAMDAHQTFDPLEFDRFTRVQELTRMMAESVNDVATVQRNLQRAVDATEDGLAAQTRQTRELQRDLLRTRMVEFEGIADRLYRVVRQASKETGKQVRLDILGGTIEMDRAVLDRMTPAFEHLLRNCVGHGIELPDERVAAGKAAEGHISIQLAQEGNDVSVVFADDGRGLNLQKIRDKALSQGLLQPGQNISDKDAAQLIFAPGLTTATEVTGLSGRGIGMDVVRSEVAGLGGRVETDSVAGLGTRFRMVLPLTTAVTQVVMLRAGQFTLGVPSGLVQVVRRVTAAELAAAYASDHLTVAGESVPFYWAGALLQTSRRSEQTEGRTFPVVIFQSASQRVALHVDEVLGNQEVVVKNLGLQLSRLPGLAAMTVLASGAVALIYNPVALSTVYGAQVHAWLTQGESPLSQGPDAGSATGDGLIAVQAPQAQPVGQAPLVLVVDDSITVRRVTQRLLVREGYRVVLASDGLQALEKLQDERPAVVLSDIEMPRMDGFDLARNIRADQRLADLPIIMITSRIAEKHREHARQLGVDHYLGKPYSEDELLALLQHFCANALSTN